MAKDKTSRRLYIASGTFGCLPSLLLFLFAYFVLGRDTHMYLSEIFNCLVASFVFGVLGVIGLISAAMVRAIRNAKGL